MKYSKPELVLVGSAISTIEAGTAKFGDCEDGPIQSPGVYQIDE
jgi:hypothetical protein